MDINPENGIQTVYIADERGTGYIFQAWECQNIKNINGDYMPIEEGDFVYITGHLSRYNKNSQIKAGYVSRYAVDPFVVRVSADPDKGYATISGKYEFTLADMNDVQFTLTAIPEPGYEFVMWIDPQFVNPSDPDAATGMQVAETILQWYNTVTHFSEEQLQEYLAEEGMLHGSLVVADSQTGGRGRRGRGWVSPPGESISFSLLLKPSFSPDRASMLTILMAISIAEVISALHPDLDVKIKWPNDVLVNGKKVCGILTEMEAEPDYIHYVIIGVGINVNQTEFPEELAQIATSLRIE